MGNIKGIFGLSSKNIIVTGASSGIGRSCAIEFSKYGASVALVGRDEKRLHETLEKMYFPDKHMVAQQDLTQYEELEGFVTNIVKKIGKIDGLLHAAGIEIVLPLKMLKPSHFENIFAINVTAGFQLAKEVVKKKNFSEQGGSLVFIASVAGISGQAGKLAYSTSKAAVINGTKTLALELAPNKVRVNAISPGICKTEMSNAFLNKIPEESKQELIKRHPLGIGEPQDIANAAIFLLSDASRWITGTNLIVDGGYTA